MRLFTLRCFVVWLASMCLTSAVPAFAADSRAATIEALARSSMAQYHLKAILVRVTQNGNDVYTGAMGESMTGVPATTAMHFRNGAMAFTYMSTLLLTLVDAKKVGLDDKVAAFFPDLPHAHEITLRNLSMMTSGYADYVYQPEVLHGVTLDPFRQWTPEELIHIGVSKPMMFAPGTNFGYSHTNYVILGRILEKVTGMGLNDAMQRYIFGPMHLTQTQGFTTPEIPTPVMHAFSSERREDLRVPASLPFYEESTFWNPSWTTIDSAVQVTDITDMAASMEAVGSCAVLSPAACKEQIAPTLIGFGHADPACPVCQKMTPAFNYGMGIINLGPWIVQSKLFAGSDAAAGYLPAQKLAIAVEATYEPAAFDDKGNLTTATPKLFAALANALAPGSLPQRP